MAVAAGLLWVGSAQANHPGGHKGSHAHPGPAAKGKHNAHRHSHDPHAHHRVHGHHRGRHVPTLRLADVRRHHRHGPTRYRNWWRTHGVRFDHGYLFRGRNQPHWSFRCWHPRYRTWCYWCPSLGTYYYWCGPRNCYYPVSYCPTGSYDYEGVAAGEPVEPDELYVNEEDEAAPTAVAAETGVNGRVNVRDGNRANSRP
jgi:hypothetical protein